MRKHAALDINSPSVVISYLFKLESPLSDTVPSDVTLRPRIQHLRQMNGEKLRLSLRFSSVFSEVSAVRDAFAAVAANVTTSSYRGRGTTWNSPLSCFQISRFCPGTYVYGKMCIKYF